MLKTLLHWWRLLTEPSGEGKLFGSGMPTGWRVRYRAHNTPMGSHIPETVSGPMAYDTACDYASMFDGVVERAP